MVTPVGPAWTRRAIGGTASSLLAPADWSALDVDGTDLVLVESAQKPFVSNCVATFEPDADRLSEDVVFAVLAQLSRSALIDLRELDDGPRGLELLLCHVVGDVSVTALQRSLLLEGGVLTLTYSGQTSGWGDEDRRARQMLASAVTAGGAT